jgi:tRNA G18 (ribose-2'-O)-methylase SpoU
MSLIQIESIDDDRIAVYRDLPNAKLVRASGLFIAEGRWLVERLAASSFAVHSILVDENNLSLLPTELPDTPVFVTPRRMVEQILGFDFHRGVIACGYRRPALTLSVALARLPPTATVVACCDVFDPTNLGGILRNCAAFGVDAVLLSPGCADRYSRRVLRVSMGAVFKLPIVESQELARDLLHLRDEFAFNVAAAVLEGNAEALESATRTQRFAIVIGNESQGVQPQILAECGRRITIPMALETDSLNAAVASGIFLYHFTREISR